MTTNETTDARRYRIVWLRCDPRTGEATGPRGVLCPGPLTHAEACTALRKFTPRPWRREMLEEIADSRPALADGGGS